MASGAAAVAVSSLSDASSTSFELSLLKGSALVGTGLFVAQKGLGLAYRGTRAGVDWLTRSALPTILEGVRPSCWNMRGMILVARDQKLDGAVLLAPNGIFYLEAPGMRLYEFCFANPKPPADTTPTASSSYQTEAHIRLPPHVFFLYRSALCALGNSQDQWQANLQAPDRSDAALRHLKAAVTDWLLHMLLNDLVALMDTHGQLLRELLVVMLAPTTAAAAAVVAASNNASTTTTTNKNNNNNASSSRRQRFTKSSEEILTEWLDIKSPSPSSSAFTLPASRRQALQKLRTQLAAADNKDPSHYFGDMLNEARHTESMCRLGYLLPLGPKLSTFFRVYLHPSSSGGDAEAYFLQTTSRYAGRLRYSVLVG